MFGKVKRAAKILAPVAGAVGTKILIPIKDHESVGADEIVGEEGRVEEEEEGGVEEEELGRMAR